MIIEQGRFFNSEINEHWQKVMNSEKALYLCEIQKDGVDIQKKKKMLCMYIKRKHLCNILSHTYYYIIYYALVN